MPILVKRDAGGCTELIAYSDESPEPPEGYRFLTDDEQPQAGDMAYNVIGETWHEISHVMIDLACIFGEPKKHFRFTPVRKIL